MRDLDEAIRNSFADSPHSVDDILIDHDLSDEFVAAVNGRLGTEHDGNHIRRRLITLRKRGSHNGGLQMGKPR